MKRTHRVSFFAPPAPARPYAPKPGWTAGAQDVPANLQPLTGDVRQMAAGREIGASAALFVPAGTAVDEDMGVVVESGPTAEPRYRVLSVAPRPAPWDTKLLLSATPERFE